MRTNILILMLIAGLAAYGLLTPVAYAGHPACDPHQPRRPPCGLGHCAQMGKDGKPTGAKCSSYCAKGCCGCGKACTVDYPGEGQNPDEEGFDLASGKVD